MSTKGEVLYHPVNGSEEQTWDGFSWPAFFFGVIWLAAKGLWGHFVVNLLIVLVTSGFAAPIVWIVYGFIGNGAHKSSLLKRGYLTRDQHLQVRSRLNQPNAGTIADQLGTLAALRDKGDLTEAEFQAQKSRILT